LRGADLPHQFCDDGLREALEAFDVHDEGAGPGYEPGPVPLIQIGIARRPHVARVARAIAYLRSDDTTLMGSRNGHAVLAVWTRLMGHRVEGFRRDAETSRQRAVDLAHDLRAQGVPVLLNPFSLTVLFPEPDPSAVKRFQLSCTGGQAHAIVMPNVGEDQLRRFREAYLAWWEAEAGARAITGEVTRAQESGTFAAS
jgi:histidine decarboxylase